METRGKEAALLVRTAIKAVAVSVRNSALLSALDSPRVAVEDLGMPRLKESSSPAVELLGKVEAFWDVAPRPAVDVRLNPVALWIVAFKLAVEDLGIPRSNELARVAVELFANPNPNWNGSMMPAVEILGKTSAF